MTRRTFIKTIVSAASAAAAGVLWLAVRAKTLPSKFVRAGGCGKYPGALKPLPDTFEPGKWSG